MVCAPAAALVVVVAWSANKDGRDPRSRHTSELRPSASSAVSASGNVTDERASTRHDRAESRPDAGPYAADAIELQFRRAFATELRKSERECAQHNRCSLARDDALFAVYHDLLADEGNWLSPADPDSVARLTENLRSEDDITRLVALGLLQREFLEGRLSPSTERLQRLPEASTLEAQLTLSAYVRRPLESVERMSHVRAFAVHARDSRGARFALRALAHDVSAEVFVDTIRAIRATGSEAGDHAARAVVSGGSIPRCTECARLLRASGMEQDLL
jgi:hypothetical protein